MTHSWAQDFFFVAAIAVLAIHLFFNVWYVFGAAITKGRPGLEVLHILTLIYGVIAENATFNCPLTLLEKFCQARAGMAPYHGPFELHYMRAAVAPSFPLWLLQYGAIGVFLVNVAIYTRRFALHYAQTHRPAH
ncbi:MAG TPA: DUF2784 family protein [Candidatus Acidoferrales bacterium]|nr:DUF2784 family protein [Candidatus Acidoferrales bacterium]